MSCSSEPVRADEEGVFLLRSTSDKREKWSDEQMEGLMRAEGTRENGMMTEEEQHPYGGGSSSRGGEDDASGKGERFERSNNMRMAARDECVS